MSDFFGGVLGALGNLAGGFINQSTQESVNAANRDAALQAYAGQGMVSHYQSLRNAADQSGFNPLALLPGAQFYSPPPMQAGTGLGDAMSSVGQNISRAFAVNTPHDEKMDHLREEALEASIRASDATTTRTMAETMRSINPVGSPPAIERRLAWPLDIPDDLSRKLKDDTGGDLNSLNARIQGWGRSARDWMNTHGFFGQDPGAGAWTN